MASLVVRNLLNDRGAASPLDAGFRVWQSHGMTAKLIQMGASLLAILALGWIALKLGLGGDARIRDEAHLRERLVQRVMDHGPAIDQRVVPIEQDGPRTSEAILPDRVHAAA